ncbi:Hypothetical Protein FCC1311_026632 [Hondaea fermentalgiana]|uniref:Uncharacterized protein n=1 Tax=Hondaea fermentalgiana TaxID=2315210 RepID=A0A2R5G5V6_9STRA|nr:Hypothetical Protein FCC1311_026632 [Hondaea fermentalgiana]|eukprot:GBG26442.1 Hypothetical Protein FCC1311_026632 [Hondaea fermentalgiana]
MLHVAAVALGACTVIAQGLEAGIELEGAMLVDWPMVATHNAGTGYLTEENAFVLPGNDVIETGLNLLSNAEQILVDVAKNQRGNFGEQLDCGARALVIRPRSLDGRLIMHHNAVGVNVTLDLALKDVLAWCSLNPGELVLLGMFYCFGPDCESMMESSLADAGITYMNNCSQLVNMTVTEARALSELTGGGSALAVAQECIDENYDPEISCRLSDGSNCNDSGDFEPFKAIQEYLIGLTSANATSDDPNQLQFQNAHWQYDAEDLVTMALNSISILEDSDESGINSYVAELIDAGLLPNIKLLQVDNICSSDGEQLVYSMQSQSASQGMRSPVPNPPSPASTSSKLSILTILALLLASGL